MVKDNNINIKEAKKSLLNHIKLLKSLKSDLDGPPSIIVFKAIAAAWCLHRYINDQWLGEISHVLETSIAEIAPPTINKKSH